LESRQELSLTIGINSMGKPMNRLAFAIFLGLAATNLTRADFVQLPGHFGGFDSDATMAVAENFQFSQTSSIGKLIWWGGNYGPTSSSDTFTVQLYADVGGQPGGLLSGFVVGNISATATGGYVNDPDPHPEYRYSADLLTPFVAQAGTTYWLSITYSPTSTWLWEASTPADIGAGVQRRFNGGSWEPYYDRTAMQLVVVPEPSCGLLLVGAVASGVFVKGRRKSPRNA
jgi:hypothetical protein